MAQTAMTVRLDSVQKAKFDQLCEQFGMSANTAIHYCPLKSINNSLKHA